MRKRLKIETDHLKSSKIEKQCNNVDIQKSSNINTGNYVSSGTSAANVVSHSEITKVFGKFLINLASRYNLVVQDLERIGYYHLLALLLASANSRLN